MCEGYMGLLQLSVLPNFRSLLETKCLSGGRAPGSDAATENEWNYNSSRVHLFPDLGKSSDYTQSRFGEDKG